MNLEQRIDQPMTNGSAFHIEETNDGARPTPALTGEIVMRGRARAALISVIPREPGSSPVQIPAPKAAEAQVLFTRDLGWWVTWCAVFLTTFIVGLNFIL